MNNQDVTKFEFLLTLEGNIICQRFFNVREHNPQARRSMDIHDYVKEISDEIFDGLRIKTSDYLYENREYFYGLTNVEASDNDEKEHFLLEMENKLPAVLAEFKKGNLPEDGLKAMVALAQGIMPHYK